MNKLLVVSLLLVSSTSFAGCFGSAAMQTCTDNSGNTYNVSRYGNTTHVQGRNSSTGNTWNSTSNTYGNTTYTQGTDADGNSWSQNSTNYGNGMRSVTGTDSDGNPYNYTCNQFGCN